MEWLAITLRRAALLLLACCAAAVAAGRIPLDDVVQIDTQGESACALRNSGEVFCWGRNLQGQLGVGDTRSTTVALQLFDLARPATRIAVGSQFACALLDNGAVQCWGANHDYQLGAGTPRDGTIPGNVPGLPSDLVGLTAGGAHACAWTAGGALYCWGQNIEGQLGRGPRTQRMASGPVSIGAGVTFADAGDQHTCVVMQARPWCFGRDTEGQVDGTPGNGSLSAVAVPAPAGMVDRVAAGARHSCAWYADRAVRCWGNNALGQLGSGDYTATPFRQVSGIAGTAVDIAAGVHHACARMVDGPMRCWGDNFRGALGNENVGTAHSAMPVPVLDDVTSMAGGVFTSCAVARGVAHCWGDAYYGATGHGERGMQALPAAVHHGLGEVRTLVAGDGGACVLGADGRVACWGRNGSGQLATGGFETARAPVAATVPAPFAALSRGAMTCGVTTVGAVHCAGAIPTQNAPGYAVSTPTMTAVAGLQQGVASVATGHLHACALTTGGQVRCWGNNYDGQLGDGSTTFRASPVAPQGLPTGIQEVRVGGATSCARSATAVYCWGWNGGGQVGSGSLQDEVTFPQAVPLPAAPRALAMTNAHGCVILANGEVHCWGINGSGQLGDGTGVNRTQPVRVQGLTAAASRLAVGNRHGCALQIDGRVACWGSNSHGQLATHVDATPQSLSAITAHHAPAGVVELAAGTHFTCALDAADRAWCWGTDDSGELGDGGGSPYAVAPVLHFNRDHLFDDGFQPRAAPYLFYDE